MTMTTTGRIANAIPLLGVLGSYQRPWLRRDLLAALTVWALLVPQGLAYAQLAGLDPVFGLYAGIGALVGYALLGRVRELSAGPEATVALLSASTLGLLAGSDPARYIALAGGLALMVGVMLFLAGLAGLGFVTRYLSRPLLLGYVTGSAVVMIVSQLDSLIGIQLVAEDDTMAELIETVRRLSETDAITLAIGLLVIAVVVVVRRINRRIPAYLVAVLVAIAISAVLDLAGRGVNVVGSIPAGLPPFGVPDLQAGDLANLALPAVAIAFLVFADSGVTGQVLTRRAGYRVDANGEFFALAASNAGAALTGGFPVNGSQSRSFTAADVGVRSQVASLLVAGLVIVTLLLLTPLFAPLPKAALAGVIIVVAAGLFDPAAFRRLARLDRSEAGLAVTAAVIVVVIGMLAGVIVVIVLSLLLVAQRASVPRTAILAEGSGGRFRTVKELDTASRGFVVYRFDAPLFFANAQQFADEILALTEDREPPVRWIIVSGEAITGLDSTAEEMLRDLLAQLETRGVALVFARTRAPFRHALERSGLTDILGAEHLYPTVRAAVDASVARDHDPVDGGVAPRQQTGGPAVRGSNHG
jgi:sulfate permease, SulP family